jgi:hypothetical protein
LNNVEAFFDHFDGFSTFYGRKTLFRTYFRRILTNSDRFLAIIDRF